jgi:uncharacterized protein
MRSSLMRSRVGRGLDRAPTSHPVRPPAAPRGPAGLAAPWIDSPLAGTLDSAPVPLGMKPFYFGSAGKPLLGLLHAAARTSGSRRAVVVCPPFGPEYMRAYRALRELSHRLAAEGLCTVRFDYYGTGDSSGREDEGTPEQWLDDIEAALVEAQEASGGGSLSIVGLRLGATLAVLACRRRRDIDRLVLWDPVVIGRTYLAELVDRHNALVSERPRPRGYRVSEPPTELLGTPVTPAVLSFLESLDLRRFERPPAARTCVISSDDQHASEDLVRRLLEAGADVHFERRPGPRVWLKEDDVIRALVPHAAIGTIASWLAQ